MTVLTQAIIHRIINDFAPYIHGLRRVGLVGSYARDDYTDSSDVDLVFDLDSTQTDNTLTETVVKLRQIFADQFRKGLDVIKYDSIFKYMDSSVNEYRRKGYQKMLEDLRWIWEANDELYQH
jgi:predicted nucleotidyltransferase